MMKCYLLLRDNKESGPYSLEELKAMDLKSNDLIWVEGISASWKFPSEIPTLKGLVPSNDWKQLESRNSSKNEAFFKTKNVFVSLPCSMETDSYQRLENTEVHDEEPVLETRYCQSFEEMKALYAQRLEARKKSFRKKRLELKSAVWIAGLFLGMACCAFVVKKMVEGLDDRLYREDVPTAVAIKTTATNVDNAILDQHINATSDDYQNAMTNDNQATPNGIKEAPLTATKNTFRKTTKSKNISRVVNIKSNKYHVGVFGGVQDLKLTIMNNSEYTLDGVTVKVAFLKPNGQSIKEEEIEAKDIPAKGAKTIEVPSSNRGIKVKYEIIKVKSKNYDNLLET